MNSVNILKQITNNVEKVILGKREQIELALMAIISGGHILVEDVPGVGKTSLVSAFAKSIDCSYKRIQFTPDVMPSDITGFSIYNKKTGDFEYKEGAVLNQFIQADEINRTSSKTQASLLEAMEERQVTVDGTIYQTPSPFIVFATQNPDDYVGTFRLPEAQLDRFFMKLSLGYPANEEEINIILQRKGDNPVKELNPVTSAQEITGIQEQVLQVYISKEIGRYIVAIMDATRTHGLLSLGASPRASLNLARGAAAWAFYSGRDYVVPDDVQKMACSIISHRVFLNGEAKRKKISSADIIKEIIMTVGVPFQ